MTLLIDNIADDRSAIERIAMLGEDALRAYIAEIGEDRLWTFRSNWKLWARPSQNPPASGDWRIWLILAGRGFGKTRAGAEWIRKMAQWRGQARIALVGATLAEVRAVMVEGDSGLLAIAPPDKRPVFEPSLRRLTWPNGAQATMFAASEPEGLRGTQHHFAWADEIGKWPNGIETWDNLMMTMRMGVKPQTVVTTTPRPVPLVKMLAHSARDDVVITRGRTGQNRSNLAPDYLAAMQEQYGGTRLGRQEIDGELIEEAEGALWSRELIERCRVRTAPEVWRRVVIGVDPPAGASASSDACGIVVVAQGIDQAAYVIEDASVQGLRPEGWARAVANAAVRHHADRVIAEANNGGAMVESVLRAARSTLPITLVHASHGKAARAEPVMTLYATGKAWHVGAFPALEDELAGLIVGGDYAGPGRSPDRADALVWAMSELMLGPGRGEPRVRVV